MKHVPSGKEGQGTEPYPDFRLISGWVSSREADDLYHILLEEIIWEQHYVTLFGKRHACPRLSAWHGDSGAGYSYSGNRLEPAPWTAGLAVLRDRLVADCGVPFNSVLLNRYRSGADSMGWHADDEPELGPDPVIASLSLGGRRKMRFRHKVDRKVTADCWLGHGSLLIMEGRCQTDWQHALPKTRKPVGERINLTFRRIYPG